MKATWRTDHQTFRAVLRQFRDQVESLAHEMFQTDDNGELPIYIRITDRTAFHCKDITDNEPLDIGFRLADKGLARQLREAACSNA